MSFRKLLGREQDDKLLVAKDKKYSAKCFVGNWPGEKLLQDEKLKQFLEKRERGQLLVQKTQRLREIFLAPTQLSAQTFVSFDQAIQLIACDMPNIHSTMNKPLALSVVVNEPHINFCQGIDQRCDITCAPTSRPTARSTFIIRKPISMQRHRRQCNGRTAVDDSEKSLKYGQDFMLECYESVEKPLMLYSSPQSPFSSHSEFLFKTHGETKQSVGLALQKPSDACGDVDASTIPSKFFHWRFYHINPDLRYETTGENIPINAKAVIVQHGFSRRNLCCEKALLSTVFGMECGVSCHTEKNVYGVESESNVWRISVEPTAVEL